MSIIDHIANAIKGGRQRFIEQHINAPLAKGEALDRAIQFAKDGMPVDDPTLHSLYQEALEGQKQKQRESDMQRGSHKES